MQLQNHETHKSVDETANNLEELHGGYRIGLAYGRIIHRFRWAIIVVWFVALMISAPFAATISSVLSGGGFSFSGSESIHVANVLKDKLHRPYSTAFVVFQSDNTLTTDPAYQQEVNDFMTRANGFTTSLDAHNILAVVQGGVGDDKRTTFVIVSFNNAEHAELSMPEFRKLMPTSGPARAYLTGDPAVFDEITQITLQDTEHAEITALPIALIVLVIVFGTLIAAFMPIGLAFFAVPVALGVIYLIATQTETSFFVLTLSSIVGLGISIDYSLLMVRRFREELACGRPVPEAVGWTLATAGEAILFSGLTVMIGFIGLLLIGIPFTSSYGYGGALVVASAVLGALTLLPAILSVLGHRVNSVRIPLLNRFFKKGDGHAEKQGFWHTWAMTVMQRPVLILVIVIMFLLGLGWPVLSMQTGTPTADTLPINTTERLGLEILQKQFPVFNTAPIQIVLETTDHSDILTAPNLAKVAAFSDWLAKQKHIKNVTSLTRPPLPPGAPVLTREQIILGYTSGQYKTLPGGPEFVASIATAGTTLVTATSDTKDNNENNQVIDNLRAEDVGAAQGLTPAVGGAQAIYLDFDRYLYGHFPRTIIFIVVATYILLLLMFRSVLLPLKAIIMNILSISVSFGVLVVVFQWGYFSNVLGFTSEHFVESTIPIIMFCVLFGLSMDYEVFLLSRIREEWLRTHDNRWAVARGLEKTAGVITNAALLFIIVTSAFTFTTLLPTKEIGLGMTTAIFIDSTVIRLLLVPATMRLLGRWNWWLPGQPLPVEQHHQE